jgi:hypothetical protein
VVYDGDPAWSLRQHHRCLRPNERSDLLIAAAVFGLRALSWITNPKAIQVFQSTGKDVLPNIAILSGVSCLRSGHGNKSHFIERTDTLW